MPPISSEITFWLGIMRDHTLFIRDNLGPLEVDAVQRMEKMHIIFEDLLQRSATVTEQEATRATEELILLKKELLMRLLNCRLVIHLEPSDLNQMINEAREFLRVLGRLPAPPADALACLLHLNRLWISDAATHSAMLYRMLDPLEHRLLRELHRFERDMNHLFLKAITNTQMIEKLNQGYPGLTGMFREVEGVFRMHLALLKNMENSFRSCSVLNNGIPLVPDHMIREETYFLTRMTQIISRI